MNLSKLLIASLIKQDIYVKDCEEIPFNVHTIGGIDYFLCFLIAETEKYVVVAETTMTGTEELRIIKKDNIDSLEIVYGQLEKMFEKEEHQYDVMYG